MLCFTHTHTHTHKHTHTHSHTYTHTHTHTHTHIKHTKYTHTNYCLACSHPALIHKRSCLCVHTHAHTHTHVTRTHTQNYTHTQEYVRGGHLRPQMGVSLKCELSMVAKTGNNRPQFPEVVQLPIAPELECCRYWQKCLIACGVNPIFHHKISIAGHPHYQIT